MPGSVTAVHLGERHRFSKAPRRSICLLAGRGVEGDAHAGATVQHRSRVRRDPSAPNLRQVHLIHVELFDELARAGFTVGPGDLGENVTTAGIDVLGLATGALLHLGPDAVVQVTGLRNPCVQIDRFQPGLMAACLDRDDEGRLVRKAGIMGIVVHSGEVHAGDAVVVEEPSGPRRPLEPV